MSDTTISGLGAVVAPAADTLVPVQRAGSPLAEKMRLDQVGPIVGGAPGGYTGAFAGAVARTLIDKLGDLVTVEDYGAKGNGVVTTATVSITSGNDVLTISSGATMTAADVGKYIEIPGAGLTGAPLVTTIAAFISGTSVRLATTALTSVAASVELIYGTDDTLALQAALDGTAGTTDAYQAGQCIRLSGGKKYLAKNLVLPNRRTGIVCVNGLAELVQIKGGATDYFVAHYNWVNNVTYAAWPVIMSGLIFRGRAGATTGVALVGLSYGSLYHDLTFRGWDIGLWEPAKTRNLTDLLNGRSGDKYVFLKTYDCRLGILVDTNGPTDGVMEMCELGFCSIAFDIRAVGWQIRGNQFYPIPSVRPLNPGGNYFARVYGGLTTLSDNNFGGDAQTTHYNLMIEKASGATGYYPLHMRGGTVQGGKGILVNFRNFGYVNKANAVVIRDMAFTALQITPSTQACPRIWVGADDPQAIVYSCNNNFEPPQNAGVVDNTWRNVGWDDSSSTTHRGTVVSEADTSLVSDKVWDGVQEYSVERLRRAGGKLPVWQDDAITITPSMSSETGSFGASTRSLRYYRIGDMIFFSCSVSIPSKGTAGGFLQINVPWSAKTRCTVLGWMNSDGGANPAWVDMQPTFAFIVRLLNYGTIFNGDNILLNFSGCVEVN